MTTDHVPSIDELWSQCLKSNNEGVTLMMSKRFDEASSALIRSLGIAKSILCHHHSHCHDTSMKVAGQDSNESSKLSSLPIQKISLQFISKDDPDLSVNTINLDGVYREVFTFTCIPTPDQLNAGCTEDCLDTLCMAIVFNLAFSHHLLAVMANREQQALVTGSNTHACNAVSLYELVYTMHQQRYSRTVGFRDLREEMYMGILCNLGHVHNLLGQVDKASQFFQHLLAIMVFFQSSSQNDASGRSDQYTSAINESARETFSSCVCSRVLQTNNAAPAA